MGMLSKSSEELTITRKAADGSSVTIKSPSGSSMDIGGMLSNAIDQPRQMNQGGYSSYYHMNQGGGMPQQRSQQQIQGQGSPVADDVPTMLTEGEFVMNVPATQMYRPLLEEMNQKGREMLAQGGWIDEVKPQGLKEGGEVDESPWAGFANYSQRDFLNEANNAGAGVAPAGAEFPGLEDLEGQQYPEQVVLDPKSSPVDDFERMNTLVTNGIYKIQQDRAGRAIYQLTDLGNAHNVRAQGSGVNNPGVDTQGRTNPQDYQPYSGVSADPVADNAQAQLDKRINAYNDQGSGRGGVLEAPGARQDANDYGQATGAPSVTPEGSLIRFKAGQRYTVATKAQASQFVAEGVVAVGAEFITNDGTIGVAE